MSNAIDASLYSLFVADTGTGGINHASTGATGGFHQLIAPQSATFPRVHFNEVLTTADYSFTTLISDHCYYQITAYAVDGNEDGATVSGRLAERARVLVTDPVMTVTGKTLLYSRFERTIPPRADWDDAIGKFVYAKGFYVELWLA